MKSKFLLLTVLFSVIALGASALGISLQYPYGAHQVNIDQTDGIITLTILDPEGSDAPDVYLHTQPFGMVLSSESQSIEFEYTSTAPFKITKVWYAPDGGQFIATPDVEAETNLEATSDWAKGSFSIAAGVEELGFGQNKNDWMRIDFEVAPGTVIKLRNLNVPGTKDPIQASPDGKVRKGYYLKLEAEDFKVGQKGETWFTNNWNDDGNADLAVGGKLDYGYYLGKGYGSDGVEWGEDDTQSDIAAHENNTTSAGRYLYGMGSFWHDSYAGDKAVDGKITFEEARNNWGAWFDYDFEVAEECDVKIDLSASAPSTIWRIMVDRDTDDNPEHNPDYVQVEGLPENGSWMKTYVACAQLALDGEILTSNQDKLPTVVDPRDLFNEHGYHTIWALLGDDTGKNERSPEWFNKIWEDGFNTPELWTKDNPDPRIVHILPNAQSKAIFTEVDQQYHIDTYEASFGYPLYTQHLTAGKHTLRLYSLAQKWYFDYIRIEALGESSGIKNILNQSTDSRSQVFNLNGMLVGESTNGLKPGIYVVKNGGETKKVIVK